MNSNSPKDHKSGGIDLNTVPIRRCSGKSSRVVRSHTGNTFTDDWNTEPHYSNESESEIGSSAPGATAAVDKESDAESSAPEMPSVQTDRRKRRQTIYVIEGTEVKYQCNTCKRVFGSGQALGGHRSKSVTYNCTSPSDISTNDKSNRQVSESHVSDGKRNLAPQYRSRPEREPAVNASDRSDGKQTKTYERSRCHRRGFKDSGEDMTNCVFKNTGDGIAEVTSPGRLVDSKEGSNSKGEALLSLNLNQPPPNE